MYFSPRLIHTWDRPAFTDSLQVFINCQHWHYCHICHFCISIFFVCVRYLDFSTNLLMRILSTILPLSDMLFLCGWLFTKNSIVPEYTIANGFRNPQTSDKLCVIARCESTIARSLSYDLRICNRVFVFNTKLPEMATSAPNNFTAKKSYLQWGSAW